MSLNKINGEVKTLNEDKYKKVNDLIKKKVTGNMIINENDIRWKNTKKTGRNTIK